MVNKTCTKCGKEKDITAFPKDKNKKDGHAFWCKECFKHYHKIHSPNYYKNNKEDCDNNSNMFRIKNPIRVKAAMTLRYHKSKGHKINISIDEVEHLFMKQKVCPICGVKLTYELGKGYHPTVATLDRINNSNELQADNVWIICHRCNTMKGDQTMDEYIMRSKMIVDKFL